MIRRIKITILYTLSLYMMASAMKRTYEGYQVLRVFPEGEEDVENIKNLDQQVTEIDFWSNPALNRSVDIMLSPKNLPTVKNFLLNRGIKFEQFADVQNLIDMEDSRSKPRMKRTGNYERRFTLDDYFRFQNCRSSPKTSKEMDWYGYQSVQTIHDFLDDMTRNYSHLPVRMLNLGYTFEGRSLKALEVGSGDIEVFIEGGAHAREWISPAAVTYFINELLRGHKKHPDLFKRIKWYILPVANPDGYEYSRDCDRMWRKNRSKRSGNSYGDCIGVDLNRNWDFHWNEIGSESNPCKMNYAGPHRLSEKETQAISTFTMAKKRWREPNDIQLYVSFHSYGQYWLAPWGWTTQKLVDLADLLDLGREAVSQIHRIRGAAYKVGTIPDLLKYLASGASDDWAKGKAAIKYSFTVELPDTGMSGFLLPSREIIPTGEETFVSLAAAARYLIRKKDETKPSQNNNHMTFPSAHQRPFYYPPSFRNGFNVTFRDSIAVYDGEHAILIV